MTEYTLIRSRRGTLAIHIKPDGSVEVRAPLRLAKSEIERFIASKVKWIEKKQAEQRSRSASNEKLRAALHNPVPQYAPGAFEPIARELVSVWETQLGVKASFVGFRGMTSRWGSCTAKTRRIRLNKALAYCPQECLEYVIVHELAHLRESNHSPRFWKIVVDALPDYKEYQAKLRALSYLLNMDDESREET